MGNIASSFLKLAALVGGAVLGTLLGLWFDKVLTEHEQEQSERDRTRYAQGLSPISQNNRTDEGKVS